MSDSIRVAIKLRPLIKREKDENSAVQWKVENDSIVAVDRPDHRYTFDHVFDMGSSNLDVYTVSVKSLVESAVNGFNGTIFAYGQTSSGKTYTMLGTPQEPGVIPLAIEDIFETIANTEGREFLIRVCYLEIYNEKVNDLLHKDKVDLKIHEDANGQVRVNCKEEVTRSSQKVLSLMQEGAKNRRTGETNMNERSSRSHTIFRITIESRETGSDSDGAVQVSQLDLVDLAGSERTGQTGATGERFKEGKHINMSLSTLGLVIKQLSESEDGTKYVNFRDSKLTRILQTSLGGNARTTIICAVTPATFEETQCTLAFASRAKCIKNKPQRNEVMSDAALLKRYNKQMVKLSALLEIANQTNQCAKVEEMESQLQEKDRMNRLLENRIQLLKAQIVSGSNALDHNDFKNKARRRQTWGGPSMTCNPRRSVALPTIAELDSTEATAEELRKINIKRRQSIMEIANIENEKFQTEITDFEMELIESEKTWGRNEFSIDSVDPDEEWSYVTKRRTGPRVQFKDNVTMLSNAESENTLNSIEDYELSTPSNSRNALKPETPKEVLRGQITKLTDEFLTLQTYTTLEKQLLGDEKVRWEHIHELEERLRLTKKSFDDSQTICLEMNKKYAELKDQHCELEKKYDAALIKVDLLERQVASSAGIEERLKCLEFERENMQREINEGQKRLKVVEEERNDLQFQIELSEKKHKTRETELEKSLQIAWMEHKCMEEKLKCEDISNLRLLVDKLTKELSMFKTEANRITDVESEASVEQESQELKLADSKSELQNTEILSLVEANAESKLIIGENLIKMKAYEDIVDAFKLDIDRLTSELETKSAELLLMKTKFEELEAIGSQANTSLPKSGSNDHSRQGAGVTTLPAKEVEQDHMETEKTTAAEHNYDKEIDERDKKIMELQNDVLNLKDQLAMMQSEKTIYEGEKCAMQIIQNEYKIAAQKIEKLENQIADAKILSETFENTNLKLRHELNAKTLELEAIGSHKYEREIQNLKSYVANLEEFNRNCKEENEELKARSIDLHNDLAELKVRITEQEKITQIVEEEKKHLTLRIEELLRTETNSLSSDRKSYSLVNSTSMEQNLLDNGCNNDRNVEQDNDNTTNTIGEQKGNCARNDIVEQSEIEGMHELEEQNKVIGSRNNQKIEDRRLDESIRNNKVVEQVKTVQRGKDVELDQTKGLSEGKDTKIDENIETSSIFANASYFDAITVSIDEANSTLDDTMGNLSLSEGHEESHTTSAELDRSTEIEQVTNADLMVEKNDNELLRQLKEAKATLEEENGRIKRELQLKIQEYVDISNDVQGLRSGMEKLEQTICLLTDENVDMATKWAAEQSRAKEAETEFQAQIDDLYSRISKITEEKLHVETELRNCQELLENTKLNVPVATNDEAAEVIQKFQAQIDSLTEENIELSTNLMEKLKELDRVKESKALHYDHDCQHKDRVRQLSEEIEALNVETRELTDDLMEKITENDSLTNSNEILKQKLEAAEKDRLVNTDGCQENTTTELRMENDRLRSENIELKAKVQTLYDENEKFSEKLIQNMAELENYQSTDLHHRTLDHLGDEDDIETLRKKLSDSYQEIERLKRLNEKLSDLKLNTCEQCVHLKEMNHSRRSLKLEVKSLNHKIKDLQMKFNQKCADTEILRNKACEELNLSSFADPMLGPSAPDSLNVTATEEKIQTLNEDLECVKRIHNELLNEYDHEAGENLDESNSPEDSVLCELKTTSPSGMKNRERIERIQVDIDKLRGELRQLKKHNSNVGESLHRFIGEKTRLQSECDDLRKERDNLIAKSNDAELQLVVAKDKLGLLENDVASLNEQITALRLLENQATREKLNLETEIDILKAECNASREIAKHHESAVIAEKEISKSTLKDLEHVMQERDELKIKLHELMSRSKIARDEANIQESYRKEIEDARECISKELKSLKSRSELSHVSKNNLSELFREFLKTIINKEQEIVKTIKDQYEQEKQIFEDAKRQSDKAEKEATNWAKELERDIEKLQNDAVLLEKQNSKLTKEIDRLENNLKESEHEKQLLKEKMEVLESDFNALQMELNNRSKFGDKQDEAVNLAQERERLILLSAKNRETELQNNLKVEKDRLNKRIEELNFTVEKLKSENAELKCNIEGLEVQETQQKNIIGVKSVEIAKLQHRLSIVESEHKQLGENCSRLNADIEAKTSYINEIKNVLKAKCDIITEYKGKLETVIPENETLKEQLNDRREYAEKFKCEYETLRAESTASLNSIKDQLNDQLLKTSNLNDELNIANGKNKALLAELEKMKSKCEELEKSNASLTKKVRNSTSNAKVEAQLEDLKDQNATLKKNAEGASNRILELQESKNLVTRNLLSLQGKYKTLLEENEELKKAALEYKKMSNSSDVTTLRNKLDSQIQQKNQIALELEGNKLTLMRKEKDLSDALDRIEKLKIENAELNEEMDDMVKDFRERDLEISRLQNIILESGGDLLPKSVANSLRTNSPSNTNSPRNGGNRRSLTSASEVYDKAKDPAVLPSRFSMKTELLVQENDELHEQMESAASTAATLTRENSELRSKVSELELKLGSQSRGSSRSSSPTGSNRRKQRRSDLFNQNRPLDSVSDSKSDENHAECRCQVLAQQVRDLEYEIVSKNGKIAALDIQIQSANFPYQKKCRDLEENLLAFKNKNLILKEEIKRLQRAMISTSISECDVCRRRCTSQRDQNTQTLPEPKTCLSGMSSGIVDDYARIVKLEKEKAMMRKLCQSRTRRIKELEQQMADLEAGRLSNSQLENEECPKIKLCESIKSTMDSSKFVDNTKSVSCDKPYASGQHAKRPMKENTSVNILDHGPWTVSAQGRTIWNRYP